MAPSEGLAGSQSQRRLDIIVVLDGDRSVYQDNNT
jgi:hypothetical protein